MDSIKQTHKLYAVKKLDSTFTKNKDAKIIQIVHYELFEVNIPQKIIDDIYEKFDDGDWESHGVANDAGDTYIFIRTFLETLDSMIEDLKSDDASIDELKTLEEWERLFRPYAEYDSIQDRIINLN
jgi:hypothetical protein